MSGSRPPTGLERLDGHGGSVLWVDPRYASEARSLGLLEAEGFDRAVASAAPGAAGRGATAVIDLPGHGERLHLRPLRRGGWLGPLLGSRIWRITRPLREVERTRLLRELGAPVPRPILVSGLREGWSWRAAVGTLHEENSIDVASFLGRPPSARDRQAAAWAVGAAIRRFHDLGGSHRDLHVGNLLLRRREDAFEVVIVDLDRVGLGPAVSARRRAAELTRLTRSLYKRGLFEAVGPRGCAALLGGYAGSDRALRRRLVIYLRRQRCGLGLHRIGYHFRPIGMG